MKKVYSYLLCALSIPLISVDVCKAQSATSTALALKAPPANVAIDGVGPEWGDSLSYYNPEKKIHYTLANDKTTLYLVVKTKKSIEQADILSSGITFSIDTKGRKKSAYSITFPVNTGGVNFNNKVANESLDDKILRASVTRFKKIGVSGFKDIDDETLGTTNTFGIKVAVSYDEQGNMVYEEAIPLELFHAGPLVKNEWSFNIKINGIDPGDGGNSNTPPAASTDMTTGRSSSGGRGGGGRKGADPTQGLTLGKNSSQGESTPSIDFWGKFTLAAIE